MASLEDEYYVLEIDRDTAHCITENRIPDNRIDLNNTPVIEYFINPNEGGRAITGPLMMGGPRYLIQKPIYKAIGKYEHDGVQFLPVILHKKEKKLNHYLVNFYKDMTSKFDLFSPINSFLEECLMVKREILEKFISLGATGFAWCEIENYTTELYEDLRDDETEPALKMEENVVEDIKLDITEKLKSNDIDVCLEADSKESLDSFKNSYSGKDLDNCVNQMYEDLLDNYTVASAVFQHWLNEEGDFDDEIHSEDWSDERQKELIKKYMDLELFTVGIYKGRVISFEVCLDDVSITAEIKEDGSFGDITTE